MIMRSIIGDLDTAIDDVEMLRSEDEHFMIRKSNDPKETPSSTFPYYHHNYLLFRGKPERTEELERLLASFFTDIYPDLCDNGQWGSDCPDQSRYLYLAYD